MTIEIIVFFIFLAAIIVLLWRLVRGIAATEDRLLNFMNARLLHLEAELYRRQHRDYEKLREEIRQSVLLIRTWSEPDAPKEAANDHA